MDAENIAVALANVIADIQEGVLGYTVVTDTIPGKDKTILFVDLYGEPYEIIVRKREG